MAYRGKPSWRNNFKTRASGLNHPGYDDKHASRVLLRTPGFSRENSVGHFPTHVREAKVSARIAIGELLVVQTQNVQQGRV